MIGWIPHSTNPVHAGVRFRCSYPLRSLSALSIPCELYDSSRSDRYSTVVIQEFLCLQDDKNAYPTGAAIVQEMKCLKRQGVKLIIDSCDNHLYQPKTNEKWRAATEYLAEMLQLADHLVFSTTTLSEEMLKIIPSTAPVSIIGDAVETSTDLYSIPWWRQVISKYYYIANYSAYQLTQELELTRNAGGINLVWFGNHGSLIAGGGMEPLQGLHDLLHHLSNNLRPLSLTIISNNRTKYEQITNDWKIPTHYCDWYRPTFYRLLHIHDICVIPIELNPYTLCKTSNRLATAISCGLAVVADSIPSYLEFKDCCSLDDWEQGLTDYLLNTDKRQNDVSKGMDKIKKNFSHEHIAQLWENVFNSL